MAALPPLPPKARPRVSQSHGVHEKALIQKYTVVPRLPSRLKPLLAIARNLWWVWNRNAMALFRRIDLDLWEESGHNPVLLLGSIHPARLTALADDPACRAHMTPDLDDLRRSLDLPSWYARAHGCKRYVRTAYFSAEFGLHECLPLYSGCLGNLSGDHINSSDELGLPLTGVGLCY